jgi:hypothetical protein
VFALGVAVLVAAPGVHGADPGIPPAVDPGTPTYTGLEDPVPAEAEQMILLLGGIPAD